MGGRRARNFFEVNLEPVRDAAHVLALSMGSSDWLRTNKDIEVTLRRLSARQTPDRVSAVRADLWHRFNDRTPVPADFAAKRRLDGVQIAEPVPGVIVRADGRRQEERKDLDWQPGEASLAVPTEAPPDLAVERRDRRDATAAGPRLWSS